MNEFQTMLYHLGVALVIGLLVGIQRGWKERRAPKGERVAGVRTYALIGMLGGVSSLLGARYGALMIGLLFIGLAAVSATVYRARQERDEDAGVTSLVASLLTFVLGALAGEGEVIVAVAASVVTILVLNQKPLLHHWVRALEPHELRAGIELLLISAVLLPILPNQGYGPWQALNPYAIWWMVVLIGVISFVGYFAIKVGGTRNGALFTGLFGGLASSTAVTLHFSRLTRREPSAAGLMATSILLACGTMVPRTLLIVSLINPALFQPLLVPLSAMAVVIYVPALLYLRSARATENDIESPLKSPLELRAALLFGALLAVVLVLGKALRAAFGDAGILAMSWTGRSR
jgi:uncharacterized membrane protein (DUF4010 family)